MSKQIGGYVNYRLGRRARTAAVSVLAAAALALTACSGSGGAATSTDETTLDAALATSIDEAVEQAMTLSGSTSAIVGVWTEGGNHLRGFGDVDSSTRFRGAEATQPVMCALLLDLVADGRLSLDRKVSVDLTRQVGIGDVTYGQLCTQTSGLAEYKGSFTDIYANNPSRLWGERELLSEALVRSPLEWPGLNFNQSDTNALLLGRAIEIGLGEPIEELLAERVYAEAGMGSTYYPDPESLTIDGGMEGLTYPSSGGEPVCDVEQPTAVPEVSSTILRGAGATVTTAADLRNFYASYLGGEFGGSDLASLPTETIPTKNPERDENGEPVEAEEAAEPDPAARMWGFGVEQYGPIYGRSGAITGTLSAAYHDPESGYSVVVALNNSSAGEGFVKALALQLAALSAEAGSAPEMPWTAEAQATALTERAVCQPAE